ncbi:MAG TPA: hypothetical protein VER58_20270 [Thermoanaerobaculia bacterium]|nr:hypothetical protein [Thermoanaerobaculia bacterium]
MRYVALAAIVASLTLCLSLELIAKAKIDQRNAIIEQKRRELQPVAAMAAAVEAYSKTKDELQRRIDLINQLKQSQLGPVRAMQILTELDTSSVDSIAIDRDSMTINARGEVCTVKF